MTADSPKTLQHTQKSWVTAAGPVTTIPHVLRPLIRIRRREKGRKPSFPFVSAQEQWQLQALTTNFFKCPLILGNLFLWHHSVHRSVWSMPTGFHLSSRKSPAPRSSSLLRWTMKVCVFFSIIFIISNVFHKLDLKRENSPPYLRSDYQMMMDNRLIRVTQGDTSSCV